MKKRKSAARPSPPSALGPRAEESAGTLLPKIPAMFVPDPRALVEQAAIQRSEAESPQEKSRQSQAKLAAVHDRYRDLYEFAPVGYLTLDCEQVIREANLTAATMLGVERGILLGTSISRLAAPKCRDICHLHVQQVMASGRRKSCELPFRRPDGEQFFGRLEIVPIETHQADAAGCRVTISDVTDHKRAEEKMAQLASFALLNPNPVLEVDLDGHPTFINPAADVLLPYLRQRGAEHPFLVDWRSVAEACRRPVVELPDRELLVGKRWFHQSMSFDPATRQVRIYALDITDRKRREERIAKLSGLYAVLSRVNEAIVRARDTGALFRDVCRIVAEEGGFPLVWIGQVEGRNVTPVASSGEAADYLKQIKVETDGQLGMGPTGTCVRENQAVINNDFQTSAAAEPWRAAALGCGFRSSAAFPLRRQGKTVAALTLYAGQPDPFDAEEVGLLSSLCADVSFALDALEHEQVRRRGEDRQRLLSEVTAQLLESDRPQQVIESLCRKVMDHLDCHVFFNYLLDEQSGQFRLNACGGVPDATARQIQCPDYGPASCGAAAQEGGRIAAERRRDRA